MHSGDRLRVLELQTNPEVRKFARALSQFTYTRIRSNRPWQLIWAPQTDSQAEIDHARRMIGFAGLNIAVKCRYHALRDLLSRGGSA